MTERNHWLLEHLRSELGLHFTESERGFYQTLAPGGTMISVAEYDPVRVEIVIDNEERNLSVRNVEDYKPTETFHRKEKALEFVKEELARTEEWVHFPEEKTYRTLCELHWEKAGHTVTTPQLVVDDYAALLEGNYLEEEARVRCWIRFNQDEAMRILNSFGES